MQLGKVQGVQNVVDIEDTATVVPQAEVTEVTVKSDATVSA